MKKLPKQEIVIDAVPSPAPAAKAAFFSEKSLKKVFLFSLLGMLLTVWFTGYNVGFDPDEIDMNNYGRANFSYYATGGKDTSCIGSTKADALDPMIRYYGTAFENIAVGFNKITGIDNGVHEYNSRHALNQLAGVLSLLFAGLIARRMGGWQAAIFTIWLAFLSPSFSGHFYFNTKDIPFGLGYIASLYFMVRFLTELPNPTWKTSTGFMLSFYFTINIRIGGLMVLLYFFLFLAIYLLTNKQLLRQTLQNAKAVVLKLVFVIGAAMALMVLTWPFLLMSPMQNIAAAMGVAKKFPLNINLLYKGYMTNSLSIPPDYVPHLLWVTMPVLVIILLAISLVLLAIRWKRQNLKAIALVLFAVLFPIVYAMATHASLYCGWRHFLFIYPAICIIAAMGLSELFQLISKPAINIAIGILCLLLIARPVTWAIKNIPYQYTYFNEFAGDYKTAYYNYDTDYWMISGKKSIDWLIENEHIDQTKDTITIGTNMTKFMGYYISKHYPTAKIKVVGTGVTTRDNTYWQYGIFNTLFMQPSYLENFFTSTLSIHSEDIDGLPASTIIKDMMRLDKKALDAMVAGNYPQSDSLYTAHVNTTHDNNPGLLGCWSIAKAYSFKNDEAIALANKCINNEISPLIDYYAVCALGIANANKGNYDQSEDYLRQAIKMVPNLDIAKIILQQVHAFRKKRGQ